MNRKPAIAHGAPIHDRQNLPVRLPEKLVGRDADLDTIRPALKAGTAVLLHGLPGVGKTALASALAASYVELPGGVLWFDLLDDTFLSLLNRVARAYGVAGVGGEDDLDSHVEQIAALLQQERPLVVLDGAVRDDVVRDFVRRCAPGVPLLFTQTRLVPGSWTPHEVAPLSDEDTQALLADLGAEIASDDDAHARQLLQSLAGNPLSITIAAYQLAHGATPEAFLAHMPALPPGPTNRVMGVLMAAYRSLPAELQGMVVLAGTAFAGGASEELLADVTGASPEVIRERMRQLVERGLLSEQTIYGQPYFVAHDLMRRFAHAFLRGKRRLDTMRARHLHGISVYVRRHVDEQGKDHVERLAAEMDNFLAAGRYAATHGKLDFLKDLVQLLSVEDDGFAYVAGFKPEIEWLRYLIEVPAAAEAGILGRVESPPESDGDLPGAGEPVAEPVGRDREIAEEEEPSESPPSLPEQMPVAENGGDSEAGVEATVASDEPVEPQVDEDAPPAEPGDREEAGDLAETIDLPTDAEALERLARKVTEQADPEQVIARYAGALKEFRADGKVEDELAAIEALAMLSLESEKYDDVLAYVDQGMKLAQETDNPRREGELLLVLGDLQAELERWEGAEAAYREAVNAFRPVEAWLDIGVALDKLGSVYWEMKRFHDAVDVWEQTLPIFERAGRRDFLQETLQKIGDTCADLMRWDRAQQVYEQLVTFARTDGDKQAEFEYLSQLGGLLEARGEREQALLRYRQALYLAFSLEDQEQLAYTLLALARLLIDDTVHLHRALQLLEAADRIMPDDTEIQRLLGRAKTRQERLMKAGVTLQLVDSSLQEYARGAYDDLDDGD